MKKRLSPSPAIDYRLVAGFEAARRRLQAMDLAADGDKPLGYWALPSDRHLPLALVDRKLSDVLSAPFDDLRATPSVGPKKLTALITLLNRAALPRTNGHCHEPPAAAGETESGVSEADWSRLRASIVRHGLGNETLGRFAVHLCDLPRAMWQTPLHAYAALSLAEIRVLKTHGEKRIAAVVEVFERLHAVVSQLESCRHLAVRIVPRFIEEIEAWAGGRFPDPTPLEADELRAAVVGPLLRQVADDAREPLGRLVECRLPPRNLSVQRTARELGLTRGRIYELLNDLRTIFDVRWPDGATLVLRLRERAAGESPGSAACVLLDSMIDLCFSKPADRPPLVAVTDSPWLPTPALTRCG